MHLGRTTESTNNYGKGFTINRNVFVKRSTIGAAALHVFKNVEYVKTSANETSAKVQNLKIKEEELETDCQM